MLLIPVIVNVLEFVGLLSKTIRAGILAVEMYGCMYGISM